MREVSFVYYLQCVKSFEGYNNMVGSCYDVKGIDSKK